MPDYGQLISNLTNRVNSFITNAKKVSELDPQTDLNPSSEVHVMINGESQKITVQQILDAFVSNTYKELVSIGTIPPIADGEISIPPASWRIADVLYETLVDTVIEIPLALTGNIRTDIFVGNTSGQIVRIAGVEDETTAIAQPTPYDTVYITQLTVNDSGVVEEPEEPIIGNLYYEKEFFIPLVYNSSGIVDTINMDIKKAALDFTGTVAQVSSIQKNSFNYYVSGQPFVISNKQTVDVLIKNNNGSGNLKFRFPNGKDYVLKAGYKAAFIINLSEFFIDFIGYIPESTGQKTITGDVTLDDSYNNCIVKIKATATITVPYGLIKDWNAVFDSWAGATATFVQGTNVDIIETTLTLLPGKMATLYQDGSTKGLTTEVYKLKGETT